MRKKRIFWLAAATAVLLSGCTLRIGFGGDDGRSSAPSAVTSESSQAAEASSAVSEPADGGDNTASASVAMPEAASGSTAASETQGTAGEISREAALDIALTNAGVASEDAFNVKTEQDREQGIPIYQVEFDTASGEYDYEIAREDGRIIGVDYEIQDGALRDMTGSPVDLAGAAEQMAAQTGAAAEDINIWEERDDGRTRYEGNVYYDGVYYEFEVDPDTGTVTDWSAEVRE